MLTGRTAWPDPLRWRQESPAKRRCAPVPVQVSTEWRRKVLPGQGAPSPSRRAASAGHASNSARCRSHSRLVDSCIVLLRCCILLLYQARERWAQDFEFICLTWGGAKGIRTPDLLHAISRQHICSRPSTQVTVPGRAHESSGIRASCGTFLLYRAEPAPLRSPADTRPVESLRIYRADYRNHARHRHRKASKSSCNGRGANGRRPLRGSHRPVDSARTPARRTPTGACRQPLNARRGPG